ncbi:hypothetical protein EBZ37_14455 [bacterium]|nr:hypothetical protein [bacterium]
MKNTGHLSLLLLLHALNATAGDFKISEIEEGFFRVEDPNGSLKLKQNLYLHDGKTVGQVISLSKGSAKVKQLLERSITLNDSVSDTLPQSIAVVSPSPPAPSTLSYTSPDQPIERTHGFFVKGGMTLGNTVKFESLAITDKTGGGGTTSGSIDLTLGAAPSAEIGYYWMPKYRLGVMGSMRFDFNRKVDQTKITVGSTTTSTSYTESDRSSLGWYAAQINAVYRLDQVYFLAGVYGGGRSYNPAASFSGEVSLTNGYSGYQLGAGIFILPNLCLEAQYQPWSGVNIYAQDPDTDLSFNNGSASDLTLSLRLNI